MGDMADHINDSSDIWDDRDYHRDNFQPSRSVDLARQGLWSCNDGMLIKIVDMTDTHLVNSYRMIERRGFGSVYLPLLKLEMKARGL